MTRSPTGHRVGAWHQKAILTDEQVRQMRIDNETMGYRKLAKKYGCGQSTARDICTYRTRWTA